jgi:hypothetical protein
MLNNRLCLGTAQHIISKKNFKIISFVKLYPTSVLFLVSLVLVLMLSIPSLGFAQQSLNPAVVKVIADAELNATARVNSLTWFTLGCVSGPIPFTAAFFKTVPPAELLLGKSPGYVDEYTKAYKAKIRNLRLKYTTMGFLSGITAGGLLFYYRYDISDWLYWNL